MKVKRVKYPRIPHLPWSHGRAEDDIALDSIEHLERLEDVVVTEKLDGENTTLYHNYLYAQSVDSKSHPSRIHPPAPLKGGLLRFHAKIRYDIPEVFRICGENIYAEAIEGRVTGNAAEFRVTIALMIARYILIQVRFRKDVKQQNSF